MYEIQRILINSHNVNQFDCKNASRKLWKSGAEWAGSGPVSGACGATGGVGGVKNWGIIARRFVALGTCLCADAWVLKLRSLFFLFTFDAARLGFKCCFCFCWQKEQLMLVCLRFSCFCCSSICCRILERFGHALRYVHIYIYIYIDVLVFFCVCWAYPQVLLTSSSI